MDTTTLPDYDQEFQHFSETMDYSPQIVVRAPTFPSIQAILRVTGTIDIDKFNRGFQESFQSVEDTTDNRDTINTISDTYEEADQNIGKPEPTNSRKLVSKWFKQHLVMKIVQESNMDLSRYGVKDISYDDLDNNEDLLQQLSGDLGLPSYLAEQSFSLPATNSSDYPMEDEEEANLPDTYTLPSSNILPDTCTPADINTLIDSNTHQEANHLVDTTTLANIHTQADTISQTDTSVLSDNSNIPDANPVSDTKTNALSISIMSPGVDTILPDTNVSPDTTVPEYNNTFSEQDLPFSGSLKSEPSPSSYTSFYPSPPYTTPSTCGSDCDSDSPLFLAGTQTVKTIIPKQFCVNADTVPRKVEIQGIKPENNGIVVAQLNTPTQIPYIKTTVKNTGPQGQAKVSPNLKTEMMNKTKKQLRMIKNREAASISRNKKKEYLKHLEEKLSNLSNENIILKKENQNLKENISEVKDI